MVLDGGLHRGDSDCEAVQSELDVDGRAFNRRPEGLAEAEAPVKVGEPDDVVGEDVD